MIIISLTIKVSIINSFKEKDFIKYFVDFLKLYFLIQCFEVKKSIIMSKLLPLVTLTQYNDFSTK